MTTQYTLYIGLNDKETKIQKINTLEAYKIVQNTIIHNGVSGATIFEAEGFYTHDDGTFTIEKTLRVEMLFFDESGYDKVKNIVNTLKVVLNQESIAVSKNEIVSDLW